MKANNFDDELKKQLDALPQERQPERDLWRGIELGPESDTSHTPSAAPTKWYAVAASVALVACISWYSVNQTGTPDGSNVLEGEALVAALSNQHEQQKQALLVRYDGQNALTENWQQQLKELDDAAGAIKAALEEDPNNAALLRMLQNVYQQQIVLIERVHAPKWQQI